LATLRFIQDFVDIQNQKYIVKAIIYAFEAIYDNDMPKPSHDFCGHCLQKIYILSLDGLAYIYKQQKLFKKAIPLYKKMIHFDLEDRFRAKESILICYLYSKDIMTFEHAVDSLEDESLYKQAIILYNLIASEQPFVHQYLTLNEKYHFVLDAICYQYDLQDNNLSEMEKLFLDDFYQLFSQSKDVIEKLRKIHVDHSVDALL
jgi:tetratricopeptide (TPR) repeat protein